MCGSILPEPRNTARPCQSRLTPPDAIGEASGAEAAANSKTDAHGDGDRLSKLCSSDGEKILFGAATPETVGSVIAGMSDGNDHHEAAAG